mmetsp:Transcript_57571/g.166608  ORF Transcript_57571/g.166608 Transcript_57571/m.166608 type:complete len:92 (-) Transcript_57571:2855-3130(-)
MDSPSSVWHRLPVRPIHHRRGKLLPTMEDLLVGSPAEDRDRRMKMNSAQSRLQTETLIRPSWAPAAVRRLSTTYSSPTPKVEFMYEQTKRV